MLDVKQETLQIVDNGRQQAVVQQVQEVLVVNQQQNGFNNDLNNLFRKSNARRNNNDQSTVMLVVQEIQVAVDDGQGNLFQQNVFAQSAVVANRGRRATQTVMSMLIPHPSQLFVNMLINLTVFAAETLIAQNILGNGNGNGNNNNNGLGNGIGQLSNGTGVAAALPTQTAGVQLFGDKPTWSSVAADPAATLGGIWQAELQDAQDAANNNNDNQANADAAQAVKQALDAAKAGQ